MIPSPSDPTTTDTDTNTNTSSEAPLFGISPEFIEENKKINLDLVRPRQKFAPYTKAERRKRRHEVYRLHFEKGMPAIQISELMKVNRNTINQDIKWLYEKMVDDVEGDNYHGYFVKQLARLETQRTRLLSYLQEAKGLQEKLAIERQLSDIDFRLANMAEKFMVGILSFWDEVYKNVNAIAIKEKMNHRYSTIYEAQKIPIKARKYLDQVLKEDRK